MQTSAGEFDPVHAAAMGSAAQVLLQLHEIRTESAMRRARSWFAFEFHPQSPEEVLSTWLGPGHASAPYRMVTTYWDMACSLVLQGAMPIAMFNDANTEHFAVFAKLRPFLAAIREKTQYPDYLQHLERVVGSSPVAEARLAMFSRYLGRQRELFEQGKQQTSSPQ